MSKCMLAEKLPEASQINLEISDGLRVGVLFVGHGEQSFEVWLQGSKTKALRSLIGVVTEGWWACLLRSFQKLLR